jgi:hypothetical protein
MVGLTTKANNYFNVFYVINAKGVIITIGIYDLQHLISKWLEENGINCGNCKYCEESMYGEHCNYCVNNIVIEMNFEPKD